MIFGRNSLYLVLLVVLCASCKGKRPDTIVPEPDAPELTVEQSISLSQNWSKDESFKIDQFVARNNWPAKISGTGIRYYIYEEGTGPYPVTDDIVLIDFEVRLLDADTTLCYTSYGDEPVEFKVEMDIVESGLHEAIKYMKEGDKAFIILPHFLAHGLLGDMDKIPPLSPVLYQISLLKVTHE